MSRSKRLLILLAVLAAACAAAFAALHWQHRQEQLQTSGQAVLEIDPDAVTSLAWTCGDTSLAFARGEEGGWSYPEDEAFPVDPEAMEALLSPFAPFSAAFVIEDVEDETQYGLDDPACSITIATDAQTWEIRLGDTSAVSSLGLDNYVTYDAAQEDLAQYGLDEPELTVTVDYTTPEDESGTFTLHISRDPEEKAEAEAKAAGADGETDGETDEEETVTAYARVGDSAIVCSISAEEYNSLTAASYDDLRHRKLLTADSFTSETPSQRQEVALTVYLDHETFPQVEIALYRYDGSHCLAVVDGTPACLVSRADAVNLMETVRSIVLGGEESGG